MTVKKPDRKTLIQNLKDAGCSGELIQNFLKAWESGSVEEQLCLLSLQRCRLLDYLHAGQKKLDCLDFLRYQLQNQIKTQKHIL